MAMAMAVAIDGQAQNPTFPVNGHACVQKKRKFEEACSVPAGACAGARSALRSIFGQFIVLRTIEWRSAGRVDYPQVSSRRQ